MPSYTRRSGLAMMFLSRWEAVEYEYERLLDSATEVIPMNRTTNSNIKRTHTHVLALVAGCAIGFPAVEAAAEEEIAPHRVTMAIEDELADAKHVSANRYDVSVHDGIVTLTGTVPTILEKDRAVRIAQMVKGVRSVVDRIEVKDTGRAAPEIRKDVVAALSADPATDSWEIGVQVRDGAVTLTGDADSYAERMLATKVVKGVRGVREVHNNLELTYPTDRLDYEIQQDIDQRLRWDARIDDGLIDAEVSNGEVTLDGTVGSAYERGLAITNAWVAGVKSVNAEELEVEWWARDDMRRTPGGADVSDGEIRQAVNDAMMYDPRVFSYRPEVSVENNVVTLSGKVDSLKAKRAAAQTAANTVGVNRVKNHLKVRPETPTPDLTVERSIESSLTRNPFVNRFDITVEVIDGTAHLYGDVDSNYERAQAEDIAASTLGVTEVENHLGVGYDAITYNSYYDWDPILFDYDTDYRTLTSIPDTEIADEIRSELFWSPFVSEDEVNVAVRSGVATLTGTVDSWSEYEAAQENAFEGGAYRVVNDLDVDMN